MLHRQKGMSDLGALRSSLAEPGETVIVVRGRIPISVAAGRKPPRLKVECRELLLEFLRDVQVTSRSRNSRRRTTPRAATVMPSPKYGSSAHAESPRRRAPPASQERDRSAQSIAGDPVVLDGPRGLPRSSAAAACPAETIGELQEGLVVCRKRVSGRSQEHDAPALVLGAQHHGGANVTASPAD
jgi:hypothetical protein